MNFGRQEKLMAKIIKKLTVTFITVIMIFYSVLTVCGAELKVGGMPFGVKFYLDGALVTAIEEIECEDGVKCPAKASGLAVGDVIFSLDGKKVQSALAVAEAIADKGGEAIALEVRRGNGTLSLTLTPEKSVSDGRYKAGILLKDTTAGVGTVTYINTDTGEFAGLGHGITDSTTCELLPLYRGVVLDVDIVGIKRGAAGSPGEIRASFREGKSGALLKNTSVGVYGVFGGVTDSGRILETGTREEVCEAGATILCTLDKSGAKEYSVKIRDIDRDAKGNKCFVIEVTDPALLENTGGIVQGMSGSPILQDGKLVGAVTHVFVNDPTRGYGIFIENMLSEAEKIK